MKFEIRIRIQFYQCGSRGPFFPTKGGKEEKWKGEEEREEKGEGGERRREGILNKKCNSRIGNLSK